MLHIKSFPSPSLHFIIVVITKGHTNTLLEVLLTKGCALNLVVTLTITGLVCQKSHSAVSGVWGNKAKGNILGACGITAAPIHAFTLARQTLGSLGSLLFGLVLLFGNC